MTSRNKLEEQDEIEINIKVNLDVKLKQICMTRKQIQSDEIKKDIKEKSFGDKYFRSPN